MLNWVVNTSLKMFKKPRLNDNTKVEITKNGKNFLGPSVQTPSNQTMRPEPSFSGMLF